MTRRAARALGVATAVLVLIASSGIVATTAKAEGGAGGTAEYTDVPVGHPFGEEIGWISDHGIARGYDDGRFGPSEQITRQTMAAFLHRYVAGEAEPAACTGAPFTDVPANHPFCPEITWLVTEGLATGYQDGSFQPRAPISRQTAAAFLSRADAEANGGTAPPACTVAPFPDVPADHPFCPEIRWISASRIALGFADGTFGPVAPVSRQGVAAFLYRYDLAEAVGTPVPSPGCGTTTVAPETEVKHTLEVAGAERWFLLTVPGAHDGTTPLPLVLDFHGLSEGATVHTMMSGYSEVAAEEGFVVAFPHGRFNPVRWDASPTSNPNDDLAFVDAMLDTLGQELCLDESRVYATGLSYGAIMTSLLTCTRSDRIAAVAPVAGVVMPKPCPQDRSVPILAYHGTADTILPYEGGVGNVPVGGGDVDEEDAEEAGIDLSRGYANTVADWAGRNGCRPDPVDTVLTDEVIHRVYDCPVGADVEFFIIVGGGHTWPSSEFSAAFPGIMGHTTFDVDATRASWAFFERYWLPRA